MNFNLKSAELPEAIEKVQELAGYHFKNMELLMEALTHPSFASETNKPHWHNQRLEFLGDAVLQIILSVYLFDNNPDSQEGDLTRMRSLLANEEATANYTRRLTLDKVLLLGKGENATHGRERQSILGDVFEAFLGAIYLDGGLEAANAFCLSLLPDLDYVRQKLEMEENPKGALQELCQGSHLGNPVYELLSQHGPDHEPVFEYRIILGKREIARACGSSRKQAERNTATIAYRALKAELAGECTAGEIITRPTIVALDFDGVICDSAAETAASGWMAARTIWPDLFKTEMPNENDVLAFRKIRPFLETGYQSILMMKMLQEGMSTSEIGARFDETCKRLMNENNLTKEKLIELFGATRDTWLKRNLNEWLSWHSLFPGVAEALKKALKSDAHLMIMTTKQERFVSAILGSYGIDFPPEDIWGLERKHSKEELLKMQLIQSPKALFFVEDRLKTLMNVEMNKGLESVILRYADWGYGTESDLSAAISDPHIKVFTLDEFNSWLSEL